MKKILAVASVGGHWIQLRRITNALSSRYEIAYASTSKGCGATIAPASFHLIDDFSRWDAYKAIPALFKAVAIIIKEKPDIVLTTGAAPGLIIAFAAWLSRRKTIWVDSIANVEHLSACGKIAKRFASRTYTQWPELADKQTLFSGNILG